MIAIGSDHAGFGLKEVLKDHLKKQGLEVLDLGPDSSDAVDYPVYGRKVAETVASGKCEKGIVICGSGIGISIAANKVTGIRSALCSEPYSAEMSRLHNNANVLALGARVIGEGMAIEILDKWMTTEFSGVTRHQNRIDLIEP